ncbi:MAG TPA: OmpA family protein [Bryobacteraceae bacterium]|nr:OmpA family protein [Bryobacteraceae bacterium]
MSYLLGSKKAKICLAISAQGLLAATLAFAVEPNTRTFTADQHSKVKGIILSHDGNTLKLRDDDDNAISTIDLSNATKIQMKHGMFGLGKHTMDVTALVPGLRVEADGKGNEKGDLVADKVTFDPNSMRTSKQVDARVGPIESRTGQLEGRQGQLENRAGQIESRQGELESTEKQTQQQVGQVRGVAEQANQGVSTVNRRVSDLDNYQPTASTTVYFKINSATLSDDAKKDLDDLAQKALASKGYVIEVAGFADTTGNVRLNQQLSERRANAVMQYLEQQGNIPIPRILTPAGMGTSHAAADNSTKAGRKMNRRVEVKLLVNQGLAGSESGATSSPGATQSGQGTSTPSSPSTTGNSTSQPAPPAGAAPNPPQQ